MRKLTDEQVTHIKRYLREGRFSMRAIAREYNVTVGAIQSIARGRSHKLEPGDERAFSQEEFCDVLLTLREADGGDVASLSKTSGIPVRALQALRRGFVVRAGGVRFDIAPSQAKRKKLGALELYETLYQTSAALDHPVDLRGEIVQAWLLLSDEEKAICKKQKIAPRASNLLLPSGDRLR